jgi:type I restriction enzyme, S subunit
MKLHDLFPEISLNPASAKDIKQWILQLALNGKLSKEFSCHYPIQKNKISFFEFDIPKHWKIDFFNNICDFKMGKTPPSKEQVYWDGNTPWVSIADMEQNGIITKTKKTLSEIGFDYSFNKIACKKGTLLMSFKLTIGKTSILGIDACHNEAIISIYPKEFIYQPFLFWFLPILSNIGPQVSALMGNTLNKSKLEELVIPIPPLEEQQAIVTTVEDLFKEVDALAKQATERIALKRSYAQAALKRLCEADTAKEWQQIVSVFPEIFNDKQTIKTLRETILQLAVQGKLTAKWRSKEGGFSSLEGGSKEGDKQTAHELLAQIKAEKAQLIKDKKIKAEKPLPAIEADEIPFELPKGWVWCRLGEVISLKSGQDLKPEEYSDFENIGLPYITGASNLQNEKVLINRWTNAPRSIAFKGDLLLTCKGSGVGKMGWLNVDQAHIARQIMAINSKYIELKLLKLVLDNKVSYFKQKANGLIPGIDRGTVLELIIGLPSQSEQQIIIEKVNALMGLCDKLEREVEGLNKKEDLLKLVLGAGLEVKKIKH